MIEIFKDRHKKTYIVAKDEHPAKVRAFAIKRFNGRAFSIVKGYVKGDSLFFDKPDSYDYTAKVAFTLRGGKACKNQ